ncbi:MAG: hypothetical protein GWP14_06785 [Actinobacteria bacterium]|nr:hypothetical protein [Actinomycetota bacterium]
MDGSPPQFCSVSPSRPRLGTYVLAGVIGALVAYLAGSFFATAPTLALPQEGSVYAQGFLAVPAQLASDAYGLYLIDLQNQTILLYSYGGPWSKGLRLMSARSFRYDRELVDFNSGKPSPQGVRKLLEAALKVPDSPDSSDKGPTHTTTESNSAP